MQQIEKFFDTQIGQVLSIFVIFLIFYFIGSKIISYTFKRIFSQANKRTLHKKDLEKRRDTLAVSIKNVWKVVILLMAIFALLRVFFSDAQLAPIFASAGILGVALGFGAQSLVKDFLSGIFIVSENQYRVGDVVEIEGFGGTVERVGARSTVIRDVDGNVHYFPNGMVQHVINKTMGYSMARFSLLLDPSTDIDKAIEIINETGLQMASEEKWKHKIITAPEFTFMGDFTATSVQIIVSGKTQPSDQWSVSTDMRKRLLDKFEAEKIQLGYTGVSTAKARK